MLGTLKCGWVLECKAGMKWVLKGINNQAAAREQVRDDCILGSTS